MTRLCFNGLYAQYDVSNGVSGIYGFKLFFNIGERGLTVFRQQSQINLGMKPDIHLKSAGKTCVDLGIRQLGIFELLFSR